MTQKVTLDLSKVICNLKGEPYKDMIDPPFGVTPEDLKNSAPDLTFQSLISNALLLGTPGLNPKEAHKIYKLAFEIADCKDGKFEVDEGKLFQLEEYWAKVSAPSFTTAFYSGAVQDLINKGKIELSKSDS